MHPPDEAPDYSVLGEWFIGCEIKTATVHTCTDYYGTFPAGFDAKSALSNQCTAAMGAVLKNKCDTAPAVGSCTVASQPSGGTQNAVTWTYADSNTMTTADQANAACMGTFAVHGSYTLTTM